MKRASESIIDYCRVKLEGDRRLRNVRFFISGSEAPGEGEVKLMDWINTYVRSSQEVRVAWA
jgi:5'-3' exonuclease